MSLAEALRVAAVCIAIALAGCTAPGTQLEGPPAGIPQGGVPCDYELDDPSGGIPRLMVHWGINGSRSMSGLDAEVTVYEEAQVVVQGHTTTDCIVFDMEGRSMDRVLVVVRDDACDHVGAHNSPYSGGYETVKVELTMTCPEGRDGDGGDP